MLIDKNKKARKGFFYEYLKLILFKNVTNEYLIRIVLFSTFPCIKQGQTLIFKNFVKSFLSGIIEQTSLTIFKKTIFKFFDREIENTFWF